MEEKKKENLITVNKSFYPYDKDEAYKIVSYFYNELTNGKKINAFKGEFEAYEQIAKGHALLHIAKRNDIDLYDKKQFTIIIKNL